MSQLFVNEAGNSNSFRIENF